MSDDSPKKRKRRLFPQTARELLEPLLMPLVKERGFGEVRILTQWAQIVGPRLAAQTRPISIQGQNGERSLLVAVNPSFATDLHYQQPQILERIATYCGARVVTRLQMIQQPVSNAAAVASATPAGIPSMPMLSTAKTRPSVVEPATMATASTTADSAPVSSGDPVADALASLAKALQEPRPLA